MPMAEKTKRIVSPGDEIVLASHNAGKLEELKILLKPLGIGVIGAGEAGLTAPEETETTFEGNAALKARAAAAATGLIALADDSGLEIDALGGAPGVYSARWAGADGDHAPAIARVARELEAADPDGTRRAARFVSVLALCRPDGEALLARGTCEGRIVLPPRGTGGFGYDPIFVPDEQPGGEARTFGEMNAAEKRTLSHRSRAMAKMMPSFGA